MTKLPPDDLHIIIEALLRGVAELLPNEGFDGWAVQESKKRNNLTKILRITKNGSPFLAFERLGKPINIWMRVDEVNFSLSVLTPPKIRVKGANAKGQLAPGKNPGAHSNVFRFFNHPAELWHLQLPELCEVLALVKAFK